MPNKPKYKYYKWLGWLGWIIFLAVVFATTWLAQRTPSNIDISDQTELLLPDYGLTNFITTGLDQQGRLDYQLTAQKMLHYPQANTELIEPLMSIYGEQNWYLQAQKGEISADGQEIWLQGATTLWREPEFTPLTIFSHNVHLHRPTSLATTSEFAIILTSYTQTRSYGMRAYLATEQIELLSQVKGHYELK